MMCLDNNISRKKLLLSSVGKAVFLGAVVAMVCGLVTTLCAQTGQKRLRGEGLYQCNSANTLGYKNLSTTLRAIGFVWDDGSAGPKPFPFIEASTEYGITGFLSLVATTRPVSYMWNKIPQFGNVGGGIKATLPNNMDLRFDGVGLEVLYMYSPLEKFPSIAGFRNGGTGFSPEGFLVQGGSIRATGAYERDFIAEQSNVPLKIYGNLGCTIPLEAKAIEYSQYRYAVGLSYAGYAADVYVEHSCEAFFNASTAPKMFDNLRPAQKIEVGFTENPMFITLGGRVRYDNGLTLNACVPLLISANVGSANTIADKVALSNSRNNPSGKFYDEATRGITDPFDPWYTRWKVVAWMNIPLLFNQTGSEMRRTFLLMKNVKQIKTIQLDEKLDLGIGPKTKKSVIDTTVAPRQGEDDQKRLLEIRNRREAIETTR